MDLLLPNVFMQIYVSWKYYVSKLRYPALFRGEPKSLYQEISKTSIEAKFTKL